MIEVFVNIYYNVIPPILNNNGWDRTGSLFVSDPCLHLLSYMTISAIHMDTHLSVYLWIYVSIYQERFGRDSLSVPYMCVTHTHTHTLRKAISI